MRKPARKATKKRNRAGSGKRSGAALERKRRAGKKKAEPDNRTVPGKRPGRRVRYDGLPGSNEQPTGPSQSWRRIVVARAPAFDHAVPAYLLDDNYFFLDWNSAFDELVARQLGLKRGRNHAEDFVRALANVEEVYERSKRVFAPANVPLIDMEPLVFRSDRYGEVEFEKIAVQIADHEARLAAWSVYLNIVRAERIDELWSALHERLQQDLNWSRYAISYDRLLLNFDDYEALTSPCCSN